MDRFLAQDREGLATADDLVAASVKVVTLHDGKKVLIRRVTQDEVMAQGVMPPRENLPRAENVAAHDEDEAVNLSDIEEKAKFYKRIKDTAIALGMIQPKAWLGEPSECPEGFFPMMYAGEYRDELYALIYEHSGYDEVLAQAAEFRRLQGQGVGAAPASPDDGPAPLRGPEVGVG